MWGCRSPGGPSRRARRVCLSQSRLEWVSAGPAAHAVSRSRRVEPHRLRFYTIALQRAGSSGPTDWPATAPTVPDASRDSDSHIVAVLPMSAGGSACGTSCGCPAVDDDSPQRGVEVLLPSLCGCTRVTTRSRDFPISHHLDLRLARSAHELARSSSRDGSPSATSLSA